jgi:hypothetical protein
MTVPATAPGSGAVAEPPQMGALSRLIQEALDKGDSYQRLADRAIHAQSGTTVSKPYLQKIVKNPPANPPNEEQLIAIAVALDVPEWRVQEAAAEQWLGYRATELAGYDDDVRIIVGHLAIKSKAELRRWRAMIEADDRVRRESE